MDQARRRVDQGSDCYLVPRPQSFPVEPTLGEGRARWLPGPALIVRLELLVRDLACSSRPKFGTARKTICSSFQVKSAPRLLQTAFFQQSVVQVYGPTVRPSRRRATTATARSSCAWSSRRWSSTPTSRPSAASSAANRSPLAHSARSRSSSSLRTAVSSRGRPTVAATAGRGLWPWQTKSRWRAGQDVDELSGYRRALPARRSPRFPDVRCRHRRAPCGSPGTFTSRSIRPVLSRSWEAFLTWCFGRKCRNFASLILAVGRSLTSQNTIGCGITAGQSAACHCELCRWCSLGFTAEP